ncbi:MAG: hypothetical protein A2992_09645 [Elusimicrobia bacterium RIFCSPLOWO2_01_FULL_59_12]|nr:MAG: hypothetical protein A2992_09645 [Elusimicrobia bacterium RIFCSPLOWO2_01_FULL_59_12]
MNQFAVGWILFGGCLVLGTGARAEIDFLEELDTPVQMLETEFDPSLLENLIPPAPPPPSVTLPPVIVKKGEWGGSQSGITRPARIVIRKPDIWSRFWDLALAPYSPRFRQKPEIDFSKEMVVGVLSGEQPYPNLSIEIRSFKVETHGSEQILAVRYKNMRQMQAVFSPPFSVQPFYLKKVPVFPGRVVFQEK